MPVLELCISVPLFYDGLKSKTADLNYNCINGINVHIYCVTFRNLDCVYYHQEWIKTYIYRFANEPKPLSKTSPVNFPCVKTLSAKVQENDVFV